jgi:hypothetical protein
MRRANKAGTDNEGWSYLVHDYAEIGTGLPSMKFCPWCGTAVDDGRCIHLFDRTKCVYCPQSDPDQLTLSL